MAIDPNIKKKADDIRNKIYGKEVRESLASGLEEMSSDVVENEGRQSVVEGRQDSVESQWQTVSDEMTDKDVISAPEIIAARNGEPNLKTRIDKDKQKINKKVNDLGESSTAYGVTGDGITDDSSLLQQMIDEAEGQAINLRPDGIYIISSTIYLKSDTKLYGNNSLIIVNSNVDGIVYPANAHMEKLNVEAGFDSYSKLLVRLDDKSDFNVQTKNGIFDLNLKGGRDYLTRGIGAYDNNERGVICYLKTNNVSIERMEYGVYLDNEHTSSWYNGNIFSNITMYNCKHFIWLNGTCDGNEFNGIQIQPSGVTETAIKCSGNYNKFNVMAWDFDAYPDISPYDFTLGSYNEINTGGTNINKNGLLTKGINPTNIYNNFVNDGVVFPKVGTEGSFVKTKSGTTKHVYKNYNGNQDDVLTMFDKRGSITIEGVQPTAGTLGNLFRMNRNYVVWNDLLPEQEVKITLENIEGFFNQVDVVGALFTAAKPHYIHIELVRPDGSVFPYSIEGLEDIVAYRNDLTFSSFSKIIFKFGVYSKGNVVLSRLFMSSRYVEQTSFVQTDGGSIYDDLVFEESNRSIVLTSPNNSKYRVLIDDEGNLNTIKL